MKKILLILGILMLFLGGIQLISVVVNGDFSNEFYAGYLAGSILLIILGGVFLYLYKRKRK